MKKMVLVLLGVLFLFWASHGSTTLLHKFAGGVNDGSWPQGSLILTGSTLFGMTYQGGDSNLGTIFSFPVLPIASDFNGDDVTDLVWRHYTTDGGNTVWLMSEATPPAAECENVGAGCQPAQEEIADVGAELASAQIDAEDWQSSESALPEGEGLSIESLVPGFPGPFGTISVIANVPLPALTYLAWKIVGTGDFNKDQKVDIVWRHKGNGKNMIWLMNGVARTSIVNLPNQTSLTWKIVGCGDFNGDGKCDILWRYQGAGKKNQVWIMNGTARQSIVNIRAEANLNWKIAGVGDFDKNGKADIIWRNYSAGGANRIWIMNNTAYVRNETLPAVADLNWKIEN